MRFDTLAVCVERIGRIDIKLVWLLEVVLLGYGILLLLLFYWLKIKINEYRRTLVGGYSHQR